MYEWMLLGPKSCLLGQIYEQRFTQRILNIKYYSQAINLTVCTPYSHEYGDRISIMIEYHANEEAALLIHLPIVYM